MKPIGRVHLDPHNIEIAGVLVRGCTQSGHDKVHSPLASASFDVSLHGGPPLLLVSASENGNGYGGRVRHS